MHSLGYQHNVIIQITTTYVVVNINETACILQNTFLFNIASGSGLVFYSLLF